MTPFPMLRPRLEQAAGPRRRGGVPFTFAHPAAVVALVRRPWWNSVALVAGSIAPDFEYFVRFRLRSDISHTWLGLAVFSIPMALLLTGLYVGIEGPFRRLWPRPLRQRIPRCSDTDSTKWRAGVLLVSAAIGSATHLLWDGLTHARGMFVRRIDWFREVHVPIPPPVPLLGDHLVLYRALQHASTVLGFLVLAAYVLSLPATTPSRPVEARDRRLRGLAFSTAAALGLAGAWLPAVDLGTRAVRCIDGVMFGVVASCLLFRERLPSQRQGMRRA